VALATANALLHNLPELWARDALTSWYGVLAVSTA
jgi:hypothetical protein